MPPDGLQLFTGFSSNYQNLTPRISPVMPLLPEVSPILMSGDKSPGAAEPS